MTGLFFRKNNYTLRTQTSPAHQLGQIVLVLCNKRHMQIFLLVKKKKPVGFSLSMEIILWKTSLNSCNPAIKQSNQSVSCVFIK